ncbi:hypothetical protein N7451_000166 [Penicillium sp. IBT 35674x]|nr:hypothetical protein N7451_000166 [Penicillium sp. IBT 35674x]
MPPSSHHGPNYWKNRMESDDEQDCNFEDLQEDTGYPWSDAEGQTGDEANPTQLKVDAQTATEELAYQSAVYQRDTEAQIMSVLYGQVKSPRALIMSLVGLSYHTTKGSTSKMVEADPHIN